MLAIGRDDIRRAVTPREAIDAARAAFIALSTGSGEVPPRTHLTTDGGVMLFMPGHAPTLGVTGVKAVSVSPGNPALGLPTVQGVVLLVETATGTSAALVEGTYLTQLRTGAAIGLGADLLTPADAGTLALFGAGGTARAALMAMCAVRPVREVRVVTRGDAGFQGLVAEARTALGGACPAIRRVTSAAEALAGASLVVTATTSPAPLFAAALVEPGTYIGALGAYTPTTRELDTETVLRARLIVDTRAGALAEAGEVCLPIAEGRMTAAHIAAEIGEVAVGLRPGRTAADEIVVFKSVGNAMQDLTLAARVLERARGLGLGRTLTLE